MNVQSCHTVDLILVGCVKTKNDEPSAARDLYASPLWRHRGRYAEHHRSPWFILSAKHGLLLPDAWIETYDLALNNLPVSECRAWSKRVLDQLEKSAPALHGKNVEIHAGKRYAEYGLETGLLENGVSVRKPLEGISSIGNQINWYKDHATSCCIQSEA